MLKDIFSNSYETLDVCKDRRLLTHYYANTYEDTKNYFIDVIKLYGFHIVNINDDYQEILVEMPHGEFVVTLFSHSYNETSVDFKATTTYFIPFGRGVKYIEGFYKELDIRLNLKRIGGKNNA